MDQRAGYCYSLNASAARIWELMCHPIPVGSICSAVCGEFEVDPETCAREISEFLQAMQDSGLIFVTDAAVE